MDGDTALGGDAASFLEGKLIDLTECLRDSPDFRAQLYEQERQISDLEVRLEKVVMACERMVEASSLYTDAARFFTTSIKELTEHFKDNPVVGSSMRQFCDVLPKLHLLYSVLCDQAHSTIQKSLKAFLSGNLSKVKETKKSFDRISDDLNTAVNRNAHTPKTKPQEAEEASVVLANMETQFSHHAIDYGYQVNTIHCEKGHEVVHNLLTFMRAQSSFFSQGYDLIKGCDPLIEKLATTAETLKKESCTELEKMSKRHSLVVTQHLQDGSPDEPLLPMDNPAVPIEISGYLFKKGSSGFKSWSRRYFVLRDNQLVYHSRSKAVNDEGYNKKTYVTVADDLRICTVKYAEDQERRFCFEVVTPNKSCMLQADSDAQRKKWVAYLEAGVARALRISFSAKGERGSNRCSTIYGDSDSPLIRNRADSDVPTGQAKDYSLGLSFLEVLGNDKCADCNSLRPTWASINLGIMVCIKCSGIHRSLGVHITKVRSVTLDDWEPEVQKIMCALGNARVNAIYEYSVPEYVKRPTPNSTRAERELFIKAKYVDHAFVHPHPDFTRREVPRPSPRRPASPRYPAQFMRPVSTTSLEGLEDSKSQSLSETCSLSSVDPALFLMAQNLGKVQGGLGEKPRTRSSSNLFTKFSGKIINKAKGWKASLQERGSPIVGRKDMSGGREGREELDEMSVEEERSQVVPYCTPSRKKDFEDLECKGVPLAKSNLTPATTNDPSSSTVESVQASLPSGGTNGPSSTADTNPGPSSSPPPPPKPPRTHKLRRSVSGRARIDFPSIHEQGPKLPLPPTNVTIQEGKAKEDPVPSEATSVLPSVDAPGPGEKTQCPEDASAAQQARPAPSVPSAASVSSSDLSLRSFDGRSVSAGIIPEEGFEEAREMKVAFRDPTSLKRSASLSDHRFSVMSEEWFSPNESDEDEGDGGDDDDDDDDGSLKVPSGSILTEEDHFSTPPTSPEFSPIKEQEGGVEDGGIVMVAHLEMEKPGRAPPLLPARDITVGALADSPVSFQPINVFLLPKAQDGIVEQVIPPVNLSLSRDGAFETPNKGKTPSNERQFDKGGMFSAIRTPPRERAQTPSKEKGGDQTPLKGESGQMLPKDGSGQTPPKGGSGQTPPKDRSAQTPPKESSVQTPVKETPPPFRDGVTVGAVQTLPQEKENSGTVQQPMTGTLQPDQSATQVMATSSSPGEVTTSRNFSSQSPRTKRASVQPISLAQPSPKLPRTSLHSVTRENAESPASISPKPSLSGAGVGHMRASPLSLEQCVKRAQSQERVAKDGVAATPGQLSTVLATSVTKLSDSEDVFEDKVAYTPILGNHQSDLNSLVSSFSVQDLHDIFKGHIPVPTLRIHSVDDSMLPNGSNASNKSPGDTSMNSRLSQSTVDMTNLDGENLGLENSLERSPSVGIQPSEVETVVIPDSVHPDVFLFTAAHNGSLPAALCALAHGANVNYVSLENDCRTPLLEAVDTGNVTMTEFLYQNGGKVDVCDMSMRRGCLHHAVLKDDPSMVVLLLKKGGPVSAVDTDGKDALALAMERENVNVVMLLKVTKLKTDYQKKSDDPQLEETVAEVYKDIEVVTTTEPEKLKKLNGSDNYSTNSHDFK